MRTLYWTTRACPAADALAALGGVHTVLVSTPTSYTVAVWDGTLRTADADPWPLPASSFQIAAFDGAVELRWLADGHTGRAVWLAEDPAALPDPPVEPPVRADEVITSRCVLWGHPDGDAAHGFSAWSDGRIGEAHYPTPAATGSERACLEIAEYVAHDEHGNAHVVERRLLGVTTADPRTR